MTIKVRIIKHCGQYLPVKNFRLIPLKNTGQGTSLKNLKPWCICSTVKSIPRCWLRLDIDSYFDREAITKN